MKVRKNYYFWNKELTSIQFCNFDLVLFKSVIRFAGSKDDKSSFLDQT